MPYLKGVRMNQSIRRDQDWVFLFSILIFLVSMDVAPVFIGPATHAFFVANPDGFWAEFMDNGVKKKH